MVVTGNAVFAAGGVWLKVLQSARRSACWHVLMHHAASPQGTVSPCSALCVLHMQCNCSRPDCLRRQQQHQQQGGSHLLWVRHGHVAMFHTSAEWLLVTLIR